MIPAHPAAPFRAWWPWVAGLAALLAGSWFLDLDAVLDDLLPRLRKAEQHAPDRAMAADPGPAPMPRTGAHPAPLLRNAQGAWFIGPPPEAVVWARRQGRTLEAARFLTLTGMILSALRDAGPDTTRTAMRQRLRDPDLAPGVFRQAIPAATPQGAVAAPGSKAAPPRGDHPHGD